MKTIQTLVCAPLLVLVCLISHAAIAAEKSLPTDLLEKAIYAEETKGDLDSAIALYQQLVADVKATEKLAAQAQFRLGQCLLKKNREAEARAAFEKLARDYPGEKELIAKAKAHLPGALTLGPVPWEDGELLRFALKLPTGIEIGTVVYGTESAQVGDRKVWRVGARTVAGGMMQSFSRVDTDWDDFRPINGRWKHSLLGDASVVYTATSAETTLVGAPAPKVVQLDSPVYDNEQAVHLFRRLPLATGYKTTIPLVSSLGGGSLIPIGLEVKSIDTVEVPAGRFECYRLELNVNQTFWISTDAHRYLVKFEAGGALAELIAVERRTPGQPVQMRDEASGITLVAPEHWLIHKHDKAEDDARTTFYLIDPVADIHTTFLRLHPTSKLSEGKNSPRVWAEAHATKLAKEMKELKIRPESWKILSISGRPAVGYVADYVDGKQPMVLLSAYALGPERSEQFAMMVKATELGTGKAAFDSIVSNYRSK